MLAFSQRTAIDIPSMNASKQEYAMSDHNRRIILVRPVPEKKQAQEPNYMKIALIGWGSVLAFFYIMARIMGELRNGGAF